MGSALKMKKSKQLGLAILDLKLRKQLNIPEVVFSLLFGIKSHLRGMLIPVFGYFRYKMRWNPKIFKVANVFTKQMTDKWL